MNPKRLAARGRITKLVKCLDSRDLVVAATAFELVTRIGGDAVDALAEAVRHGGNGWWQSYRYRPKGAMWETGGFLGAGQHRHQGESVAAAAQGG